MPKFRFKVSDAKGKIKAGQVIAPSLEQAEERLRKAGYTVLECNESDGPKLEVHARKGGGPTIERAESRGYQPSIIDFIEDVEMEPQRRNFGLVALALVGLIVAVLYGVAHKREAAANAPKEPQYEQVKLSIQGSLEVVGSSFDGAKLIFHFPEVPLDLERDAEGFVDDKGAFKLEYEFASAKTPTYCTLTVEKKGYKTVNLDRQFLKGTDTLAGSLPAVRLQLE
ncbi:MAG: hypothetical protein KC910_12830 [Candidatus Eremiobacteraeota bacterium]|nr:hypothetical protein [Candidatus Eremiobacteraeota bacterium]